MLATWGRPMMHFFTSDQGQTQNEWRPTNDAGTGRNLDLGNITPAKLR